MRFRTGITIRPDEAKVIEDCTIRFVQGASILPSVRKGRGFDTATVDIQWKDQHTPDDEA